MLPLFVTSTQPLTQLPSCTTEYPAFFHGVEQKLEEFNIYVPSHTSAFWELKFDITES